MAGYRRIRTGGFNIPVQRKSMPHKRCPRGYRWVRDHCEKKVLRTGVTRIETTTKFGWQNGPIATREKKVVEEVKNGGT